MAETVVSQMKETVHLRAFAYGGRAVGERADGKICFVRGGIPGETVQVQITSEKKNFSEGELLSVLKPSEKRLTPPCPNLCPGCSYQHIPYEEELHWKQQQFLSFAGKTHLQTPSAVFEKSAPVGASQRLHWRNKIRLSLENGHAGYRGEDNMTLVEVQRCLLAVESIEQYFLSGAWRERVTPMDPSVTIRWTEHDGIRCFAYPSRNIVEDSLGAFGTFQTGEGSFFQVNHFMSEVLAENVLQLAGTSGLRNIAELYCGCGCFSILCAEHGGFHCAGVEMDSFAVQCARENARRHNVEKLCRFHAGKTEKIIRHLPLKKETLLLADPPRTGLDHLTREMIGKSQIRKMIYISCGPDTFFRDAAFLENCSFRITSAKLIDMFPSTAHFELIALFER